MRKVFLFLNNTVSLTYYLGEVRNITLEIGVRKRFLSYVWNITLYECETLTIQTAVTKIQKNYNYMY